MHPHGASARVRARSLLERIGLVRLDDGLLDVAGELAGSTLRSLDAIHLAAAQTLGPDLVEVITYDRRMTEAATSLGLPVVAPTLTGATGRSPAREAAQGAKVPRPPKARRRG